MKKLIFSAFAILISLPMLAQAADLAAGKAKYQMMCASCHGANGKGDGAAAAALNPKPRNFTDLAYMSKRTDAQLASVIKNGGAANGLSPLMVAWGSSLSDADIANIVAYIRSFK